MKRLRFVVLVRVTVAIGLTFLSKMHAQGKSIIRSAVGYSVNSRPIRCQGAESDSRFALWKLHKLPLWCCLVVCK